MDYKEYTERMDNDLPILEFAGIFMTPAVEEEFPKEVLFSCLSMHRFGYYGTLCAEDWKMNVQAMETGARVMSEYILGRDNTKIWIISDAVEHVGEPRRTTILFPHEY